MAAAAATRGTGMAESSAGPPTTYDGWAEHLSDEASPPTFMEEMDKTSAESRPEPEPEPEHEPKFKPYVIPSAEKGAVDHSLYFALLHLINTTDARNTEMARSTLLYFLVENAKDVKEYCDQFHPFRDLMRDNTLWERLCRDHWKQFWGYEEKLKVAQAERLQDLQSKEWWYNKYHETEADAIRNKITVQELCSLTFSCRSWFNPTPSILPLGWTLRPGIMPTGLLYSETDSLRFNEGAAKANYGTEFSVIGSGKSTGHPSGDVDWFLQEEGGILNIYEPRTALSRSNTFLVRRLPDRGWELSSDHQVLRAFDPDRPASLETVKNLWIDYTEDIQLQKIPQELRHHLGTLFPFIYREIPNNERLKKGLSWIRNGLEPDN